ncbi:hypothetical protein [Rhodoplanes roseus]|uniref:hypothetical protein n=1 Tax=Rhodoplanes roseus TaxID=29409 RepID=UPI001FE18AE4|nr:hypothetical protein [Rhodoplanes roseus]
MRVAGSRGVMPAMHEEVHEKAQEERCDKEKCRCRSAGLAAAERDGASADHDTDSEQSHHADPLGETLILKRKHRKSPDPFEVPGPLSRFQAVLQRTFTPVVRASDGFGYMPANYSTDRKEKETPCFTVE